MTELADLTYTQFVPDLGHPVTWNVTRLRADAWAGKFGQPLLANVDLSIPAHHLDRGKVDRFKQNTAMLMFPAIAIEGEPSAPDTTNIICFVDGHHRLTARAELGMPHLFYLVPWQYEGNYHVTIGVG